MAGETSSIWTELRKNAQPDAYIIEGKNRGRHKFRHLEASELYWQYIQMTPKEIKEHYPLATLPEPHLMYTNDMYDEAVIGTCDDDGLVRTKNREHAKLILAEYKTMGDHSARMHVLSLPLDPNEAVDRIEAAHPCAAEIIRKKQMGPRQYAEYLKAQEQKQQKKSA